VIGAGNVALDIARVLAKSSTEMADTDVPQNVLDSLSHSRVSDIHVLIRRGPAEVKFTPPELRQIGQLSYADVKVHNYDFSEHDESDFPDDKRAKKNWELLRSWTQQQDGGKPRRIHLHFFRSPVAIRGHSTVEELILEENHVTVDGKLVGTGQ